MGLAVRVTPRASCTCESLLANLLGAHVRGAWGTFLGLLWSPHVCREACVIMSGLGVPELSPAVLCPPVGGVTPP